MQLKWGGGEIPKLRNSIIKSYVAIWREKNYFCNFKGNFQFLKLHRIDAVFCYWRVLARDPN